MIDEFKHVSSTNQAALNAPAPAATTRKSGANAVGTDSAAKGAATNPLNVEATTLALFRAKNAYRDEVRDEITQTELDDRHDIKGNTIFRLTFATSIIAGTRQDSVAGISVRLGHHPEKDGRRYNGEPLCRRLPRAL